MDESMSINDLLKEDLLIDILCRLPCKLAIRCKCVCKLWNSIIRSPYLIRRLIEHQQFDSSSFHNNNKEILVHVYQKHSFVLTCLPDFSLDFLPCFQVRGMISTFGSIIAYCNGLLLCCNHKNYYYYICNPLSKQWVAIPPAPFAPLACYGGTPTGFICDPFYRIDDQGGVLLNYHCRFRIVRAFGYSLSNNPEFDVDIFSSETWEWTKVKVSRQSKFFEGINFSPRPIIAYNGMLHLQVGRSILAYNPYTNKVCADIDPPYEATPAREIELGRDCAMEGLSCSSGSLWICQFLNKKPLYSDARFCMWRLKHKEELHRDHGNHQVLYWSLERKIRLTENDLKCSSRKLAIKCVESGRVLLVHPENPDVVFLSISWFGIIVSWNLKTGFVKEIATCEAMFYDWKNAFLLDVPIWPTPVPTSPTHYKSVMRKCKEKEQ